MWLLESKDSGGQECDWNEVGYSLEITELCKSHLRLNIKNIWQ